MFVKHIKPFLEWKLPGPSWHIPFLAAVGVGIPVAAGVWWDQSRLGMLAATGAMVMSWYLIPSVPDPALMAAGIVLLVFVVEYLVPRHYGVAVVFITPLTVAFAEFSAGGIPVHGLLTARLMDIVFGSVIGAAGGWVLHHPQWCLGVEQRIRRLPWLAAKPTD